ncbi:hypothetical protein PG994_015111 [Apiospora phragmitis]|uniref:Uncharacterized protein n=1 Tax=Apiospora phragmitis TaxID=2905665 RepID=A0ABR1SX95_9PEZI
MLPTLEDDQKAREDLNGQAATTGPVVDPKHPTTEAGAPSLAPKVVFAAISPHTDFTICVTSEVFATCENATTSPSGSSGHGSRVVRCPEDLVEAEIDYTREMVTMALGQQGDANQDATEDLIAGYTQMAFYSLWDSSQAAIAPIKSVRTGFALPIGHLANDSPASPPGSKRKNTDHFHQARRKKMKTSEGGIPVSPTRTKGALVLARAELGNETLGIKISDSNMTIIKEEMATFLSKDGTFDDILRLRAMAHRDMKEAEYVRKWNDEVLV